MYNEVDYQQCSWNELKKNQKIKKLYGLFVLIIVIGVI